MVWRMDRRVVGVLGAMYAVSLLDRISTGLALVTGMGVDLELTGARYNVVNALFFIPYLLFQLPATLLLRRVGPRAFLGATAFLWGATTVGCGLVRAWTDLMALRMLLGLCEAGFFPSCLYLLSSWYPRYELQKRNAAFFLLGLVPAAFSGIISYGISHMDGLGGGPGFWARHTTDMSPAGTPTGMGYGTGVAGWRWIFIIYGSLSCAVAIWGSFLVVDFPEQLLLDRARSCQVKFLTKEEAAWVVDRIERDRNDVACTPFDVREYLTHARDLKIWGFALMCGLVGLVGYGIGFALPMLLMDSMGFSVAKAQMLTAPPYVAAAIATWLIAVWSDKWKIRSPFVLVCLVLLFVGKPVTNMRPTSDSWLTFSGICLIGFSSHHGAQYAGVFFAALPQCAVVPALLTWQANNVRGQWKRALVSALSIGASAAGGLGGSFVFKVADKPHFYPGIATCLAATGATVAVVLLLLLTFMRANKRAAAGGEPVEGLAGFRYTL